MDRKPQWYSCRKWTTVSLCLLNIISVIAVILLVIHATTSKIENMKEFTDSNGKKYSKEDIQLAKEGWELLKTILIVSAVIAVLVHLFGLVAVLRDHYHLVMAYAIVMVITSIISIVAKFVVAPIFIVQFSVNLSVTSFAFLFANEIKKLKRMTLTNTFPFTQTQPQLILQPNYGQQFGPQGPAIQMQTLEWPGSLAMPPPYDSNTNVPQNYSSKL